MGCRNSSKTYPKLHMTEEIREVSNKFLFTEKELKKLWTVFHQIDTDRTGLVSIVEIFELIREKPSSIVAPFLIEYISDLEKERGDRLSFVDFTRSISKYCLLNPTQILKCKK